MNAPHAANQAVAADPPGDGLASSYDRLLKLAEVKELTGLGKTMIYRLVRDGSFPQPYKPGGYASRWSESEVCAWRELQRERQTEPEEN